MPDKLGHAIEYMLLGFLSARALQAPGTPHRTRILLLSRAFCAVFGIVDELVQSQTPGRECSVGDWAADFAGISLSHLLLLRWSYKERSTATNEMS